MHSPPRLPPTGRPSRRAGFTLVEVLVVIGIIMALTSVVTVNVIRYRAEARVKEAKIQISQLKTALQTYFVEQSRYPTQGQGLEALLRIPDRPPVPRDYPEGGYLDSLVLPVDPWGSPYLYLAPGRSGEPFEVLSYGEDLESGGEGRAADISSSFLTTF